ncbi:MAG TPA: pyrroline-5-carboxylate reductase [Burkholderiales bacterium]|nr:pyrroline-5-carboxylate reductase [Burkholderiales bacterium]
MKITFIGGGNMGSALISGLIRKGMACSEIAVVEPDTEKRTRIGEEYGVRTYGEAAIESMDCEVVVLAVKPQQLHEVASKLADLLQNQLVVSIAAGIRATDLSAWLKGYSKIVRVMPNTPAQISKGISALYAMPDVEAKERAETVLSAVGSTIWLDEEEKMDAFTALCGSGPAYVFYFVEAMLDAAKRMGFNSAEARKMVLETISGSVALASESPDDAGTLRQKVTSRGGTTERALLEMEKHDVKLQITKAILAAEERSREMGIELGKTPC